MYNNLLLYLNWLIHFFWFVASVSFFVVIFLWKEKVILHSHLFIHDCCRNSQVLLTSVCAIRVVNVPEGRRRAGVCRESRQGGHTAGQNYGGSVTGAQWGRERSRVGVSMDSRVSWWAERSWREKRGWGGQESWSLGCFSWVCDGAQILRFLIVSALLLSRSPASCSERR